MAYKRRNDDGPNDSFEVPYRDAQPGSSELPLDELDNFIVPGRDEHGAHQTVSFNAPPLLVHQIDVIVRSQLFPYINRESFIRHAAVRQMRWLQSIRPESLSQHIAPEMESILERCFQSQMRKKVQAAFEALRETILQAEHDGEWPEVLRLCYYVRERLSSVAPGSVWQQRAWRKFMGEFGGYMQEATYHLQKMNMNNVIPVEKRDSVPAIPAAVAAPEKVSSRLRVRNDFDDEFIN